MRKLIASTLIAAQLAAPSGAAFAEEVSATDYAKLVAKFGPQAVKLWRQETEVKIKPSGLSPESQNQAVEAMLTDYAKLRSSYASAKNAGEWTSLGVSGGAATVVLVAGPQATVTVPALLIAAAITTTIEIGNEELERVAASEARKLLKARRDQIVALTGLSYEQIHANPGAARQAFEDSVDIFKDVRERAGGSTEQWRNAQEMMIDTIAATSAAQLEAIEVNAAEISKLGEKFAMIANEVHDLEVRLDERLNEIEQSMGRIEGAVEALQGAVQDLDQRVENLETDQAVIADFVLDSMTARQKVKAIKDRGFLAARFRCADGQTDCEGAKLKTSLIERFEKQADLEELVGEVVKVSTAVNDVHTIAKNLGFSSPELNKAVEIGNVAANTFVNFAAGNYLGALASATSLFAKKSDPDAERFKILMRYLDKQFKQVNAKLDRIIENQIKIVEAIGQLSEQMLVGFEHTDKSLRRLAFEQKRIGAGVRSLIWNDWKSCNAVYSRATDTDGAGSMLYLDGATLHFTSQKHIKQIVANFGETSVLPCLETMQGNLASLNAVERFGSFIDLRWVIDSDKLTSALPSFKKEANEWRGILESYETSVFEPALQGTAIHVTDQLKLSIADAFAIMSRPMTTTDEWRLSVQQAKDRPFKCGNVGHPEQRLFQLLCRGGSGDPSESALKLLERPILADIINEIADWVVVMAQFADLRDQDKQEWVYFEDILEQGPDGALASTVSAGEQLVNQTIGVLDLGIASYSMIYGPSSALAADATVSRQGMSEDIVGALNANPFLAHNFLQFFLERRYQSEISAGAAPRPAESTYRQAYELAESDEDARFLLFGSLFGTDLTFAVAASGEPEIVFTSGSKEARILMPAPAAFAEGRLKLPARYFELLATREQLVDRAYSYRMIDGLSSDEKDAMAIVLTQ